MHLSQKVLFAPNRTCPRRCTEGALEFCGLRGAWEWEHVADVAHSCCVHDHALESESVACVFYAAVFTELAVPPVAVFVHSELVHAGVEDVEALFSLASADYLAYAWHEKVACGDCLAVVVKTHVEGFYVFRVVGHEHRLLEDFFGEVALVFCLQVASPVRVEVEFMVGFLEQLDGVCVRQPLEVVAHDVL